MPRFKADGVAGKVGIYTGSDDDPFDDPLGNLARVLFHSDLNYPSIVDVQSGTLALPSRSQVPTTLATYTLFAHGAAGIPLVFGRITNLTGTPALAGSVPVQSNDWGFARWITLGADATNVILHEQVVGGTARAVLDSQGFNAASQFPALNLDWEVQVTDTILE